jgi:GTP diphosphokinase / guanosine-3',5'-bis(diphosphate) 3'-diphosphatase
VDKLLNEKIQNAYNALIFQCARNFPEQDIPIIDKAFNFAAETIGNSVWNQGEFILNHSISVARISVIELGLSTDALIAALLHNVYGPHGQEFLFDEVKKLFGSGVAVILNGIIKINSLNTGNLAFQSENFRRLLLTLSGDVKVILIKIADQLQDMRTLDKQPVGLQQRLAVDTWHLYAPLAHRLGLYKVNSELLDLALKYLHPEDYEAIVEKLKETAVERASFVSAFVMPIEKKLQSRGFDFEMKARTKSIYSIWNKMQSQKVD